MYKHLGWVVAILMFLLLVLDTMTFIEKREKYCSMLVKDKTIDDNKTSNINHRSK